MKLLRLLNCVRSPLETHRRSSWKTLLKKKNDRKITKNFLAAKWQRGKHILIFIKALITRKYVLKNKYLIPFYSRRKYFSTESRV